jgi:hypothetical protein
VNEASKITGGQTHKYAAAWQLNDFAIALDGTIEATDNSLTIPDNITSLEIGDGGAFGNPLSGHISRIVYWNKRKSNVFMQNRTAR